MKANHGFLRKRMLFVLVILFAGIISEAQPLQANFGSITKQGCSPIVVQFRDSSLGNPTFWKWDLGNGTISFQQNPSVTYTTPGDYNITLIVGRNNNVFDTIVKTNYIKAFASPVVDFTSNQNTGCFPFKVQFTDLTTSAGDPATQWQWDFGNGNVSNQQHPFYTYTSSGIYTVKLKATTQNGCFSAIAKTNYINVTDGVIANFTITPLQNNCAPPTNVQFNNTSVGNGAIQYQWLFGDGGNSTNTNPTHTYTSVGSYDVTLIATNANGCKDTASKVQGVNIGAVSANFTLPSVVCAGTPITLQNTSTPASVSSNWFFSDGTTLTAINPVKTFLQAGTFTVKLVNSFGACTDSIEKSITVLPKPTAGFTADKLTACTLPLQVQFTDTTLGGTVFHWNFGNGNTSTLQNPTHVFTQQGAYTIQLVAVGANGCSDTLTKANYILIDLPKINAISRLPIQGCVPLDVNAFATINSSLEPITNYTWSFGDGGTSTQASPNYTYQNEGTFDIKLTVSTASGCTDSLTLPAAVKVGHKPVPNFDADPKIACATTSIKFNDLSTNGPVDKWEWFFGDGQIASVQNPTNKYVDTGYFAVKLVVWNNGCSDTLTKARFVYIKPPVAAFFVADPDCNNKMKVNFVDTSKGATSYFWNFGDGNSSTLQNPSHTYATPGSYQVTLVVFNDTCQDSQSKIVKVDDKIGQLKIYDTITCRNKKVKFEIDSTNTAIGAAYIWNVANNTPVTTALPKYEFTYTDIGTYPISVIIVYLTGCRDTLTYLPGVKVYGPVADFTAPSITSCSGATIQFTDLSVSDGTNAITEWTWNYGDGNTLNYTAPPFIHNYTTSGSFTVKLTVKDSYGCTDDKQINNAVRIAQSVASFTASDTAICPSSNIQFNNASLGDQLQYLWHFGDGSTSTTQTPTHSYTQEGIYTVSLQVVDPIGCADTLTRVQYIKIFKPKAAFALSDTTAICPPLLVNTTNQSQHTISNQWTFGDGSFSTDANPTNLYTYPGEYPVKLLVTNNGGCADSAITMVKIKGPTGTFTYNPLVNCIPLQVTFNSVTQNTIKQIWDYNNGNTQETINNTSTYVYTTGGNYLPKMILEDANGCRVPIVGRDTIKAKFVETGIRNLPLQICDSLRVSFVDTTRSNDNVTTYWWSFGDGTTSTLQNPTHNYNRTGRYTVKLKVTSAIGCTDSATYVNAVKVAASPKVKLNGDTVICANGFLQFSATQINADTSSVVWSWNFGNGNTAVVQNPPAQQYVTPGNFVLTNTINSSNGCSTITRKNITVNAIPVVNAGADAIICRNQQVQLQATGAATYLWQGNVNSLSCVNCPNPTARPLVNITYVVTGTSTAGCKANDTIQITVQQKQQLEVKKADTLCLGNSSTIKALGTDTYLWQPALYIDNPTSAQVNIKPLKDTAIRYMLIGKDNNNCFADTAFVSVKAYPIPKFDITESMLTVNVGKRVKLLTTSSADITKWRWTPTAYLDNATISEPTFLAKENITYTAIATNDGKCEARDAVTINVVCNNGNIFLPNTFSPNGDGANDVFYTRGNGVYSIKHFRVFNRWGEIVFERSNIQANDASAGWDGTVKGVKAAADVYVYTVEIMCDNSNSTISKGTITLIR